MTTVSSSPNGEGARVVVLPTVEKMRRFAFFEPSS